MVTLEVKGVAQVVRNLRRYSKNLGRAVERGFVRAAKDIMRESKRYVPVQTGLLAASARIRKMGKGMRTHIIVGYFGVYYAAYVHEIANPPHAHGQEFNIKHLDEIARAGRWSSSLKTRRTTFKPRGFAGTAQGGMFPRKPEEQWKFLERPVRTSLPMIRRVLKEEAMRTKV
jgi:hypothetical protein